MSWSIDTDVVVIALAYFLDVEIDKLLEEFHVYAQHLGKQKCLALLFRYSFTGCDTVSGFSGS